MSIFLEEYDAVIIGGGHNGLVCACYLAKHGLKVIVIEQKGVAGGCVATEEYSPGWKVNTCSFEHYVIQNTPIIDDLSLSGFGLSYYSVDPVVFAPSRENCMLFYRDPRRTIKEISRFSKHDSRAYEKFREKWIKVSTALGNAAIQWPRPIEEILTKEISDSDLRKEMIDLVYSRASTILSETFETDLVSAPIAFLGPAALGQSPRSEKTGWLLAWHLGAEKLARPRGGSGILSLALVNAAKRFGAELILGEKVRKIFVGDNKVQGVETQSGKVFKSKLVVSNVDPKQTFLELVRDVFTKNEKKDIESVRVSEGIAFKADYLLKGIPEYACKPTEQDPRAAATFITSSVESLSRAFDEYAEGRNPKEPGMMVALHSLSDPSLVPEGKQYLVLETRYTPYKLKGKSWTNDDVENESARLLALYSEYCPGVGKLVERSFARSPQDMENDNLLPKGNFFHADMILEQMFESRPRKGILHGYECASISGLYLCGSGAHPGGSVSGIPGRNAAMQILGRLSRA